MRYFTRTFDISTHPVKLNNEIYGVISQQANKNEQDHQPQLLGDETLFFSTVFQLSHTA